MDKLIKYICDELDELEMKASKGNLSAAEIQYGDTLAHFKKNLLTAEAMEEASDDYSSNYGSYARNGQMNYGNGTSYRNDRSYARGRRGYVKRDAMGRYSRDGEMDGVVEDLKELMDDAPNEQVRTEIHKLVKKFESM